LRFQQQGSRKPTRQASILPYFCNKSKGKDAQQIAHITQYLASYELPSQAVRRRENRYLFGDAA
jgi:hypothetical protein